MTHWLHGSTSQTAGEITSNHFAPYKVVNKLSIYPSNRQENKIMTDGMEKYKIEQG